MTSITIIDTGTRTVEAVTDVARGTFLIDADRLPEALGWELKPAGLCQPGICVPVADPSALAVGDRLDLSAVAAALGRPAVVDVDAGMMAVALPAELRRRALDDLPAPAFALPDLHGTLRGSDEWSGLKRLLVTFSSWCGCRYDLPGWQALHDELAGHGFTVIAVAIDHCAEDVRPWTEGITLPVLYDPQHLLTELYAISNVPDGGVDRRGRPHRPAHRGGPRHRSLRRVHRHRGRAPSGGGPALGAGRQPPPHRGRGPGGGGRPEPRTRCWPASISGWPPRPTGRGPGDRPPPTSRSAAALAPDDLTIWRAAMPLLTRIPSGTPSWSATRSGGSGGARPTAWPRWPRPSRWPDPYRSSLTVTISKGRRSRCTRSPSHSTGASSRSSRSVRVARRIGQGAVTVTGPRPPHAS